MDKEEFEQLWRETRNLPVAERDTARIDLIDRYEQEVRGDAERR